MSLVACKEVGQALIKWLDAASEKQRETLCDALGCDNGVSIEDLLAALQDCKGEPLTVETAIATCEDLVALYENSKTLTHGESGLEVKISEKEGNSLSAGEDGLFVEVPETEPFVDCSGKEIESGSAMVTCENLRGIFDESETIEWEEGKAPEVKISEEEGNILEVKEDGLFAKAEGGGDICGAFDELPTRTTFGEKPRMIVNDGDECFVVEVSPSGIFSDIRAGIQASPGTAIAGDTGRVSFIARNVSSTSVSKVRLIATLPAQTRDELGYEVIGEPVISNPTGATITKVSPGVWDIEPMEGGAVVTAAYTIKYLVDGTYMFSSTVEMLDENAVDFDEADDYASAGVVVRLREDESEDPEDCPMMDIKVKTAEGTYPMTLTDIGIPQDIVSVASRVPKNIIALEASPGDSVTVESAVPITLMAYMMSGAFSEGVHLIKDGEPLKVRYGTSYASVPEAASPIPTVTVAAAPDAKSFTVTLKEDNGRGALVALAVRPGSNCKWQHFAILLGVKGERGTLTLTGNPPPYVKSESYSPATPRYAIEPANGGALLGSAGSVGSSEINPTEEAILKPKSGQQYSFKVKSEGRAALGNTSATGNISVQVISPTEWDVTINPSASSADNVKLGRLTFEFED